MSNLLPPLAVITNRLSTRNTLDGDWVSHHLERESGVYHFMLDRVDDIPWAVAQAASAGAETIVVNGGDGTVDLVFAALLNNGPFATLPALALLPAGKTNMTAAGWSLKGDKAAAMTAILDHRRAGTLKDHIREQPVLTLRRSAGHAPLYGAFFGTADVVNGILFCRKHIYPLALPNPVSHSIAITTLLWRALFTGGRSGDVDVKDIESGKFFMVAVTALDELLLGVRPAPTEGEGGLHYLSLRGGPGAIFSALGQIAGRRVTAGPGRTVRRVQDVTLSFTGSYTLDGELYEARADQPLTLDAHKRLRFVRLP